MRSLLLVVMIAALSVGALGCPESQPDPGPIVFAGGGGASSALAWVPGHYTSAGIWVEPFWRAPQQPGFTWVDPYIDPDGYYVGAGWHPQGLVRGKVWVQGYRGEDGHWVMGFWRDQERSRFEWVDGFYDNGLWRHGYWRPVRRLAELVWVPGHVSFTGDWEEGHWREAQRRGFVWVDGYYADGHWYTGYWSPLEERSGSVWVPGHAEDERWKPGSWRPVHTAGQTWVPGHWDRDRWVPGGWVAGSWRWEPHQRVARYARYSHTTGTNQPLGHRYMRYMRYADGASSRPHARVKAPVGGRNPPWERPRSTPREQRPPADRGAAPPHHEHVPPD